MKEEKLKKKNLTNFILNNLLLAVGIMVVFSGLVLQLGFHMGGHDEQQNGTHNVQFQTIQYEQLREINTSKTVYGFTYPAWSTIHKVVIVFFSLLMIYHTYLHWKWYKGVLKKQLIKTHMEVISLSLLFLLVALSGLIPWFIDLSSNSSILRMLLIEIHDKLTLILIVFLVLHVIKRAKWFSNSFAKLRR